MKFIPTQHVRIEMQSKAGFLYIDSDLSLEAIDGLQALVRIMVEDKRKLATIKLVRQALGCNLRDACAFVDQTMKPTEVPAFLQRQAD